MEKSKELFCLKDVSFILGKNRYTFRRGPTGNLEAHLYNHLCNSDQFCAVDDNKRISSTAGDQPTSPHLRIGIMRNGGYGDVLLGTAIATGIRRKYPDAFITWYTTPQFIQMLRRFPHINQARLHNCYSGEDIFFKRNIYDFDMFFATKPDAEVWYFNPKLPEKYPELKKSDKFRRLHFYNKKMSSYEWIKKSGLWWTDVYKKSIGIEVREEDMWFDIPTSCDYPITQEKHAVIVCDGAGGTQVKSYPVNLFKEVVEYLENINYKVYQVGDKFTNIIPGVKSLVGTTALQQAVGYIKNCDLYIGVDGFLTHIASLYNVRNVCIYGPTPYKIWGHKNLNVVNAGIKCKDRPCWSNIRSWHNKCLINGKLQGECMLKLNPKRIIKKINEVLNNDKLGKTA